MIKVAPSILSADFACLLREVQKMEAAGADWLHIDVMDGHFVPNITLGPLIVGALKGRTNLFLDTHLMVEQPELFVEAFYRAGAGSLTVHAETCYHLHRVIHSIKEKGMMAGVALNPATPIGVLEHLLPDLDLVLIMSVNPGFAGQDFIPAVLPKIEALAEEKNKKGLSFLIEVDGGINRDTSVQVVAAGAEVLVAGSALFQHANPETLIDAFKRTVPRERNV
ncbi:MAG TPA: ribulose-phosphate 3-epimerase [Firmicutes bacterium]|nr:ribulose-phosphate 3-epimerase [Bacillota bacterium]